MDGRMGFHHCTHHSPTPTPPTMLVVEKCWWIPIVRCTWYLYLWPLVETASDGCSIILLHSVHVLVVSMVSMWFASLNSWIWSARCRQNSNVGRFSRLRCSLYKRSDRLITSRVALCWTFSMESFSLLVCGDHITDAYSRWGLIRLLYNKLNEFWSMYLKVCYREPKTALALLTCAWMWAENDRLLSMCTPRSFSSVVAAISCNMPSVVVIV